MIKKNNTIATTTTTTQLRRLRLLRRRQLRQFLPLRPLQAASDTGRRLLLQVQCCNSCQLPLQLHSTVVDFHTELPCQP